MKKIVCALAVIAVISCPAIANEWKIDNNGNPYIMNTVPPGYGNSMSDYSGMIVTKPMVDKNGKDIIRSILFAGRGFNAGKDKTICDVTGVIDGKYYETTGLAYAPKNGKMPSVNVISSTNKEYSEMVPGAAEFIDAIAQASYLFIAVSCEGKPEMVATFNMDTKYNDLAGL